MALFYFQLLDRHVENSCGKNSRNSIVVELQDYHQSISVLCGYSAKRISYQHDNQFINKQGNGETMNVMQVYKKKKYL